MPEMRVGESQSEDLERKHFISLFAGNVVHLGRVVHILRIQSKNRKCYDAASITWRYKGGS